MTKEEAIKRLKYDRVMCYFDPNTGADDQPYDEDCKEMAEALDIAIKALESEPVENYQLKHVLLLATTLNFPIEDLNLTTQAINALHRSNFKTIGEVYSHSESKNGLRTIRGIGEKLESEILQALNEYIIDHLPEFHPIPSEKAKTARWIPVSEGLPKPEGDKRYLVTTAHFDPSYTGRFVLIDDYDARDPESPPLWGTHGSNDGVRVVAWMPLPKPYHQESEDQNDT